MTEFIFKLAFVRKYLLLFSFLLGILFSCKKKENPNPNPIPKDTEFFVASFHIDSLEFSHEFDSAQVIGEVDYMLEASGLINSHYNSNFIWSHNDGGNENSLFLMDANSADLKAEYTIEGASNLDWEDIAVYFDNGFSYIYVGDVGDNIGFRSNYSLYAFEEPIYSEHSSEFTINPRKIDFDYPDGPNNCEAIMVDPLSGDLILATKGGSKTELFLAQEMQLNSAIGQITLEKIGELPLKNVTAGDISTDGKWIGLRTYNQIVFWTREEGESLSEAFMKTPKKLPYNGLEPQGEAFCWIEDGYFTLSEKIAGLTPKLYFYSKK